MVDGAIYTPSRMMRLEGSAKFGTKTPLRLVRGADPRDTLVSAPRNPVTVTIAVPPRPEKRPAGTTPPGARAPALKRRRAATDHVVYSEVVGLLDGIDHAYYHADNRDQRHELLDIATEWSKRQVIMFTPCINVGCDYSVEGHFDEIWAMASTQSAVPRELMQMLVRCRKPKSPIMHVLIREGGAGTDGPTTPDEVVEQMRRKQDARNAVEEAVRANWNLEAGGGRLQWVGGDDWLTHTYSHSVAERNRSRADYVAELERLAATKQYKVVVDRVKMSSAETKRLRARTEAEAIEHEQRVISSI